MKMIALSLFLSFHIIPISMYYIYDDNPSMGYYASGNLGEYSKPKVSAHKTYFPGNNNQKYTKLVNERVVDSHFAVLKSSPKSFITISDKEITNNPKTVHNSKETRKDKNNHDLKLEIKTEEKDKQKLAQEKQLLSEKKEPYKTKQDYKHRNEYLGNDAYDSRNAAFFKYHAYVSPESQKQIQKKNNRRNNYRQEKTRGSGVKGKVLHKTNLNIERNAQIMSQAIDDLSIKLMDRSNNQRDNKKRNTDDKFSTEVPKEPLKSISDSMKKYNRKDVGVITDKRDSNAKVKVPLRMDNFGTETEKRLMPYAVFYKMSQENIEPQDYLVEKGDNVPVETQSNFYNDKEKLMVNIENELNVDNSKLISDTNVYNNYGAFLDR